MAVFALPFPSLRSIIMPLLNASMQGKICLVTGANSGIGKATALGLAQMGAAVVMVCRDRARGEEAQREIKMKSGNEAVDLLQADLSSQQSIRQLADTFRQRYPHLHVLINNAGAGFTQRQESVDGVEMTFAVNYLAPFVLTNLLLDVLKNSAPTRIINVDSDNHRFVRLDMQDL
jgi:NAD(P)-dependent dehydrogenase (short-subunit alcohol dehydrogenase family)